MPEAVIAGYGETEFHKDVNTQKHPYEYQRRAIREALDDSGVSLREIDGLSASSNALDRDNVTNLAQFLGISGKWLHGNLHGGANAVSGIVRGTKAIENGTCETVLIVNADNDSPQGHMDKMDDFNWGNYTYMRPYGFGGANGIMALVQRRHMHEYGTTREQLSNISITQRNHARKNPKAILQEPMTKEKYLNARPIVEPIHLFDCVLPCGGGGAVVLTTRKRAEELGSDYIYVLGKDEHHDQKPIEAFTVNGRNRGLSYHTTLEQSGLTHDDIDCVQLYDNYPIWVTIQLEDLGFCGEGEGGEFIQETDLSIDGDLPLNTGGGQLSIGQPGTAGGMIIAVEAIRQLRGEGEKRQVPDCEVAIATGEGMMSYGGGLSTASVVLSTKPRSEAGS